MDNVVTLPAPDLTECLKPRGKFYVEKAAFERLLPGLLEQHRGQYAAIHDEKVVAIGADKLKTAQEAYTKHGYVDMYVHLISDAPPPVERMPSNREIRR